MLNDPETIPLHHFAGPLAYRVTLKATKATQIDIWKKWLHAYSAALQLSCTVESDMLVIDSLRPGHGVAPSVRRALLAWLVSHDAVERVRIVLGSPHPGLTIEVNVAR